MIVTTGRIIKIQSGNYFFEKSSETPGLVEVTGRGALGEAHKRFALPGNIQEAKAFCTAYMRAVEEDVGYRKSECE